MTIFKLYYIGHEALMQALYAADASLNTIQSIIDTVVKVVRIIH